MEKLTDAFDALLMMDQSPIQLMLQLAVLYTSGEMTNEHMAAKKFNLTKDMTLREALFKIPGCNQYRGNLMAFLNNVMYRFAPIFPAMNEENAPKIAIASPHMLWLHDYHMHVEMLCRVAMAIAPGDIPLCLVRLPLLLDRFRGLVLPVLKDVQEKLKEALPKEYISLITKQ
jgi:hypothetical protein